MLQRFEVRYPDASGLRGRRTGLWIALALPALAGMILQVVAVSSVSLSPVVFGSSTGTVTLDATSPVSTTVLLFSSNTALATVPASINVPPNLRSQTFKVAAAGSGCSTISAVVGTTPAKATTPAKSALLFVQFPSTSGPLRLTAGSGFTPAVANGRPLSGTVTYSQVVTDGRAPFVQLSSNSPVVTVPASVEILTGSASFTITAATVQTPSCAVITATVGSLRSQVLVLVLEPFG